MYRRPKRSDRSAAAGSRALLFVLVLALPLATACRDREDPVDAARTHLQAGRAEDAVTLLQEALARDPDDTTLNFSYGKALLAAGQPSLAVWSLAKAEKDPEYATRAGILLARAQITLGSHDEARASLDAVLEREPTNLDALRLKVENDLEARQPELAFETVEAALDQVPDDLGLLMSRMRILLTLDEADEAGETLAQIRRRIDEVEALDPVQRSYLAGRYCAIEAMFTHESGESAAARGLFERCLLEHPTHEQVVAAASDFFDATGDPEAATQAQRSALEAASSDLSRRVTLAQRMTRLGDPEAATALLVEVTADQPAVWAALVDHYLDIDDSPRALEALDRALAHAGAAAPPDWKLLRADLLIQAGDLEAADRAIDAIDSEVYAATARGRLELARGNPAEALRWLEQGIRLWPDGTMARYLAAQAAEQLGDFERAESEYREAYRSDQAYTDAGLELADLLASRGLHGDAAELAFAYTGANPQDARGWEDTIRHALAARRSELARSTLMHYQRHPAHRAGATAFAARYLQRAGRSQDALDLIELSQLDLADPGNLEVLRARCEALIAQSRFPDALDLLHSMLRQTPERAELRVLEASVLEASGRLEDARETLSAVLAESPDQVEALRALAPLESRAGHPDRARELYDRVASLDPEDAAALVAAAQLADPDSEKEKRLREALRRSPRAGETARALAALLARRGQADSAEAASLLTRARRFLRPSPVDRTGDPDSLDGGDTTSQPDP